MSLSAALSLAAHHQLEEFDCGKPALTQWLLRHARQAQGSGSARTFVSCDDGRVAALLQLDLAPERASQPPPKPLRLPQNSTNCRLTYVFALQKWQALTDKHDRQPQAGRGSSPMPYCRHSWSKQGQSQYWQALEAIKNIADPVPAKPYESKDCVLGVANCLLARMLRYLLQPAGPSSGGFSNNVPRRTPCNAPCAPYKRASP